ncbi:MAG: PilZ domain-containing protein [Leptospirales bacterium]
MANDKKFSEKRRYVRAKYHASGYIVDNSKKIKVVCATFDISEGGMRIITDRELNGAKYEIVLGKNKFSGNIKFKEKRSSAMMDKSAYYYGFQFAKPISGDMKKKLMALAGKVF